MTKREKNMLYGAFLIVILAVYSMMILPYIEKTTATLDEVFLLQQEIDTQNLLLADLPNLETQVADTKDALDDLKHPYDEVQTQESITTYFTQMAEAQNLLITSFSQIRTNVLLQHRELDLLPLAEVTFACRGTTEDYIALTDALNQQEDITVLSTNYALGESDSPTQECSFTCLLLMNAE